MDAVILSGGKQHKVKEGDILRIEKIEGDVGASVVFDKILMYSDGDDILVGSPNLDNVVVKGHILGQARAKKIIVFKFKRRKRYRRKRGHRQYYTAVKIDNIVKEV